MYILLCRETGLDCDFIIKGKTKKEFLKNGADHAIQKHCINVNDIYLSEPQPICYAIPLTKKIARLY
jgi:predicted small metal-binding protein